MGVTYQLCGFEFREGKNENVEYTVYAEISPPDHSSDVNGKTENYTTNYMVNCLNPLAKEMASFPEVREAVLEDALTIVAENKKGERPVATVTKKGTRIDGIIGAEEVGTLGMLIRDYVIMPKENIE